jgi:hypothetical protein
LARTGLLAAGGTECAALDRDIADIDAALGDGPTPCSTTTLPGAEMLARPAPLIPRARLARQGGCCLVERACRDLERALEFDQSTAGSTRKNRHTRGEPWA